MSAPKISLYSLGDLKTTLDDHIPVYLSASNTPSNQPLPRAQRFTPSHTTTYVRLGLGYSAVVIAVYLFYLDYVKKVEFVAIKSLTAYAVVAYFALNTALTLWTWLGEKGEVFAGSRFARGRTTYLKIRSLAPHRKYDPVYRIVASWAGVDGGDKEVEKTVPLTKFFAEDGVFVHAEFEAWLRQELPEIEGSLSAAASSAKPVVLAPLSQEAVVKEVSVEDDDIVLVGGDEGVPVAAASTPSASSAKKRTKRKT